MLQPIKQYKFSNTMDSIDPIMGFAKSKLPWEWTREDFADNSAQNLRLILLLFSKEYECSKHEA